MLKTNDAYRDDAKAFLFDTSRSFTGQDIDTLAGLASGVDRLTPVASTELKDLSSTSQNMAERAISLASGEYDA